MSFNDPSEFLRRYLNCQVTVSAYGHSRFVGTVSRMEDDFLVLTNVWTFSEYESGPWEERIIKDNLRDGSEIGEREVLIKLHNVTAVSCDDPLLPDIDSSSPNFDAEVGQVKLSESDRITTQPAERDWGEAEPDKSTIVSGKPRVRMSDLVLLEIGSDLVPIAEDIVARISRLRTDLAKQLGLKIPTIRLKDSASLDPCEYEIRIRGLKVGGAEICPTKSMVIPLAEEETEWLEELAGQAETEPSFGLKVFWIEGEEAIKRAEAAGHSVVDGATVLITHLGQLLPDCRHDLFTYQQVVWSLLDFAMVEPALVEGFYSTPASKMLLYRIIRQLLLDRVWVGDFSSIAHAVAVNSSGEFNACYERVRADIAHMILHDVAQTDKKIRFISFDDDVTEQLEKKQLQYSLIVDAVRDKVQELHLTNEKIVALFPNSIRRDMDFVFRNAGVACIAVSFAEIPDSMKLDSMGHIGLTELKQVSPLGDEEVTGEDADETNDTDTTRDS